MNVVWYVYRLILRIERCETGSLRLAVRERGGKKIDPALRRVVIDNRQSRGGNRGRRASRQLGPDGVGQYEANVFVEFNLGVVDQGHREGCNGLSRGEDKVDRLVQKHLKEG